MPYAVKEIFASLQGEGLHTGRPATFIRLSGCNLGYAVCPWCDTDWVGTDGPNGGRYPTAVALADAARAVWPGEAPGWCVLTGGEPALQVDADLVNALMMRGLKSAIETNGTVPVRGWPDWITLSPKAGTKLVIQACDELKLVWPQTGVDPSDYDGITTPLRYLQPMDGPELVANTRSAIDYCLSHPRWRLSEQGHKRWGLR